jgi:hypothetical protein
VGGGLSESVIGWPTRKEAKQSTLVDEHIDVVDEGHAGDGDVDHLILGIALHVYCVVPVVLTPRDEIEFGTRTDTIAWLLADLPYTPISACARLRIGSSA